MTTSRCVSRATAEQALQFFHDRPADLILVDLEPAEDEAWSCCASFKENPPRPLTPVIALAAANDTPAKLARV